MEFLKELKRSSLTLNNEETESHSLNQGGGCGRGGRIQEDSVLFTVFSIKHASITAS